MKLMLQPRLFALGEHPLYVDFEGVKRSPKRAEKGVIVAGGISPESTDDIIVTDAARLCRDRTINELRGNFKKLRRVVAIPGKVITVAARRAQQATRSKFLFRAEVG